MDWVLSNPLSDKVKFAQYHLFYKLMKEKSPACVFQLILENNTPLYNQKCQTLFFKIKLNFFKNSFFPAVIIEWTKIDVNIRNSAFCNVVKRVISKFIRLEPNQGLHVDSSEIFLQELDLDCVNWLIINLGTIFKIA